MRTKKAMLNIATSMTYQIVSIICGLIAPRLILVAYGSTYNGVIESATQFLNIISILNIGIAGSTRVAFYKTLAYEDQLGTSRIYKSNKLYMRKVALAVIAYTIILMVIYPLISHNDLANWECSALVGIIGIRIFAEYFFGISNRTLLDADQAGYICYTLNIFTNIFNTILTVLLIYMNCSIFIVKLGSSTVFLLTPAIMNIYVQKKYNLIRDCKPDDSAINNRKAVAFHSIANIVHDRTDLFVLTLFLDAKIISVYTVYYLIVGKIKSITQVFTNGMEAAFGNMWIKNETELLNKNFHTFEYALFAFTSIVFSCVGILLLPFIELYTTGIQDVNYISLSLAILITVAEGLFCIRQPYLILVQAAGKYEETKMGAMYEAIINMSLSFLLVNFIGINGVIIGTLVANLIRTSQYMAFTSKQILHRSMKELIIRIAWLIINSAIIIVVSKLAINYFCVTPGWAGWILKGIISFILSCVITMITSWVLCKKDLLHLLKKLMFMTRLA